MPVAWSDICVEVCARCGGRCCYGAHPPLSEERVRILSTLRDLNDAVENPGYRRLRAREDGSCIMLEQNRCMVNGAKPETCRAGPFTFDLRDGILELFLKKETICPLVRYLKNDSDLYREQLASATEELLRLVRELSPNMLREIVRIEEPETEKVAEIRI